MKRLRLICFIVLIIAVAAFLYFKVGQMLGSDNLGPVIRMKDTDITVSVKDKESTLLKGVTAEDTKDGDVTDSLIIANVSNFLDDGRRLVTLAAFDSDNHVSTVTRQIQYSDYVPPRFSLSGALRFPVGTTNFFSLISVQDELDGDISDDVRFTKGYEITATTQGTYKMQYEVTNSAGDTQKLPVTIEIYDSGDYDSTPQIRLTKYIKYIKKGQKLSLSSYLKSVAINGTEYKFVSGSFMGSKTIGRDKVRINDKSVDYKKAGVYEAVYSLTSEYGKTGTVRLIIVVED